jgi:aminoglycoside phosphotransferase (APT) family kinase protein
VHAEIQQIVGARVVSLEHVEGRGYTHAGRHRAFLDDGRTVFVKSAVDELSAGWLRAEIAVYESVRGSFLAQVHGSAERDGLPLLVLEDLGEAHWPPPWRVGDVEAVKDALAEIAATTPPAGLERVPRETLAFEWREVERDPEPFLALGLCSRAWLDANLAHLCEAAERAPFDGSDLLHLDVRSDNIALRDGRAVLVDWNWACAGNALLDVVGWAPSLHVEGGPAPEEVVEGEGVPELAAALAGFFAARAGLPPPSTAPRVRAVQREQVSVALPWAARALGLPGPDGT